MQSESEMEGIEVLSGVFKLFVAFGLQYFLPASLQRKTNPNHRSVWFKLYYLILLILFSSLTIFYVLIGIENQDEIIKAKNFINILIKLAMDVGLILAVAVGLTESYLQTNKMRNVLWKAKEIFMFCRLEFDYEIDYKSFRRSWMIILAIWFIGFTMFHSFLATMTLLHGGQLAPFFVAGALLLFLAVINIKFTFYVDLLHFQLQNFHTVVSEKIFNPKSRRTNKVLEARRLYSLIYEMGQLTNKISSICNTIVYGILTIIMINTGYEILVTSAGGVHLRIIISKFKS